MAMDLKPLNPSEDAPRWPDGDLVWGRYNVAGWRWLLGKLREWGVDTSEFRGCNDGDPICDDTCKKVANAIENNLDSLKEEDREWIKGDIARWRTCGGYLQY